MKDQIDERLTAKLFFFFMKIKNPVTVNKILNFISQANF